MKLEYGNAIILFIFAFQFYASSNELTVSTYLIVQICFNQTVLFSKWRLRMQNTF